MERGKVDPASKIDHAIFGNATQSSNDALYGARHVLLKAGCPDTVPGLTVNRICGSGLQSVVSGCRADPARAREDHAVRRHGEHVAGRRS